MILKEEQDSEDQMVVLGHVGYFVSLRTKEELSNDNQMMANAPILNMSLK